MQQIIQTLEVCSEAEGMLLTCGSCDKLSAEIRWDARYSGFRGFCHICKNNWPES